MEMSLKTITATVGESGANIPSDVATVQYLLNCVPVSHGGPIRELKIDGFAGVVTIKPINRFQQTHFGQSNSLVGLEQSGGATLVELKKYDPLPNGAIGGSGAEFINHSCNSNLVTSIVGGRIFFNSHRIITSGEELTLDYNTD